MTPPLPRQQFPVAEQGPFLNHAGVAPLPLVAVDAMTAQATDMARQGSLACAAHADELERVRGRAATLLGVPAVDVAFVKNTTEGLGFVANGLTWEDGNRVLVPDLEFPSTLYPWLGLRDQGVRVDRVAPVGPGRTLPLERYAEELAAAPTRLVVCSWVQYGRGWRTDIAGLADLCRRHDALLCVDVIQGLGVLGADLAAWGVDFAMADGHKWLLGPEGIGVLYVAENKRDLLRPLEPGWASVRHRDDFERLELVYDDSARRFEGGTYNQVGVAGLGASLDLLLDAGIEAVWAHVDALCDRLVDGLADAGATVVSDRSASGRSGIVTCTPGDRDPAVVVKELARQGVVGAARGGGLRLAPHGWNDESDIDTAALALRRILNG